MTEKLPMQQSCPPDIITPNSNMTPTITHQCVHINNQFSKSNICTLKFRQPHRNVHYGSNTDQQDQAATPRLNYFNSKKEQHHSILSHFFQLRNGQSPRRKQRQQHRPIRPGSITSFVLPITIHKVVHSFFKRIKAATPRHNYPQLCSVFIKIYFSLTISTSVNRKWRNRSQSWSLIIYWVVYVTLAFGCSSNTSAGRTPQDNNMGQQLPYIFAGSTPFKKAASPNVLNRGSITHGETNQILSFVDFG